MKKILLLAAAVVFVSAGVAQAETWKGVIGDSHCGGKHADQTMDHSKCVNACVDKKGGKYVFVVEKEKVFTIANQDFADLKAHAGHTVNLTGTMNGDAITVTKVEMPKAEKK